MSAHHVLGGTKLCAKSMGSLDFQSEREAFLAWNGFGQNKSLVGTVYIQPFLRRTDTFGVLSVLFEELLWGKHLRRKNACFEFWIALLMNTFVLGFMYHHVDSFKKKCDAFCLGTAMVSVFHGKTNTVCNKILPSVAKNTVAAIG